MDNFFIFILRQYALRFWSIAAWHAHNEFDYNTLLPHSLIEDACLLIGNMMIFSRSHATHYFHISQNAPRPPPMMISASCAIFFWYEYFQPRRRTKASSALPAFHHITFSASLSQLTNKQACVPPSLKLLSIILFRLIDARSAHYRSFLIHHFIGSWWLMKPLLFISHLLA